MNLRLVQQLSRASILPGRIAFALQNWVYSWPATYWLCLGLKRVGISIVNLNSKTSICSSVGKQHFGAIAVTVKTHRRGVMGQWHSEWHPARQGVPTPGRVPVRERSHGKQTIFGVFFPLPPFQLAPKWKGCAALNILLVPVPRRSPPLLTQSSAQPGAEGRPETAGGKGLEPKTVSRKEKNHPKCLILI